MDLFFKLTRYIKKHELKFKLFFKIFSHQPETNKLTTDYSFHRHSPQKRLAVRQHIWLLRQTGHLRPSTHLGFEELLGAVHANLLHVDFSQDGEALQRFFRQLPCTRFPVDHKELKQINHDVDVADQ